MTLLEDRSTESALPARPAVQSEHSDTQLIFVLAMFFIPTLIAMWGLAAWGIRQGRSSIVVVTGVSVVMIVLGVALLVDWLFVKRLSLSLDKRSLLAIVFYTPAAYPVWTLLFLLWASLLGTERWKELPDFWQYWTPEVLAVATLWMLVVAWFFLFRNPGLGCTVALLIPVVVAIGLIALTLDTLLKPVLAVGILTIGTLLPALIYSFFLKTRVPTIRQEFEANVIRLGLDPHAEHLRQKFDNTYGRGNLEEVFQTPILALTIILLLGWIMVLFPESVASLLGYPKDAGPGIHSLIFPQLTPIGFGFLGAYLFSINVLFRRYVTFDIKHGVFVSLSTRFIIVMILVWALSLLGTIPPESSATSALSGSAPAASTSQPSAPGSAGQGRGVLEMVPEIGLVQLLLLSFFAGVFPRTIMIFLENTVHAILRALRFAAGRKRFEEPAPLSDIDGVTMWDENRLFEEGIENKQNLATANIVNLLIETPFPPERLMDWVDQALWHLHVGDKATKYREHSIRTATDFLNLYRDNRLKVKALVREFHGDPDMAEVLVSTLGSDPNIRHILHWRLHDMPEHVSLLIQRGQLALKREQWNEAARLFDQALALFLAPEAYVGRAQVFLQQERFDKAKEDLQRAQNLDAGLAIPRKLADVYLETAKRHLAGGDYDTAVADLEAARTLTPSLPSTEWIARAYEGHARVLLEADPELRATYETVIRDVERLETLARPEDLARWSINLAPLAQAYIARGEAHEAYGAYQEASEDYAKATELNSDVATAWNLRAFLHAEHLKTELERATDWAHKAKELADSAGDDTMRARALDTLGWVYYQRDMLDEAMKYLGESLDLRPNESIIRRHLDAVVAKKKSVRTTPAELNGAETIPVISQR